MAGPFAAQPSSRSEILFVTGRHVRYVHIPDDLNIVEAIDAKALCCLLTRCLHCSDSDLRTRHTRTNRWHHVLASSREHDYGDCDCGAHNNHPTKRAGGSGVNPRSLLSLFLGKKYHAPDSFVQIKMREEVLSRFRREADVIRTNLKKRGLVRARQDAVRQQNRASRARTAHGMPTRQPACRPPSVTQLIVRRGIVPRQAAQAAARQHGYGAKPVAKNPNQSSGGRAQRR